MKIEIVPNQASFINRIAKLMILRKVGRHLRSLKRTLCVAGKAHTHPKGGIFKTYQPSDFDIINMQKRQRSISGLKHFIIHRPKNRRSPDTFSVFEYTDSKLSDFNYKTN
ncbi:hypothetical protein [Yeosuana sp.]|uniref:hypothetical protein n=1 Tax=Yeosuana sp. TaxID=2529388 RepID=UPI0040551A21